MVGDDRRIAAGVALVLIAGGVLVSADALDDAVLAPLTAAGIVAVVTASILCGA